MSYIMLGIISLIFLFYFRVSISNGLSYASLAIFRPVLILGNNVSQKFLDIGSYFYFKKSLVKDNEKLKSQILQSEGDRANYISVVDENTKLKEILGRLPPASAGWAQTGKKESHNLLVSAILSKANSSIYNTLIIDVGISQGVTLNKKVFALGNIPIGKIAEVDADSSKVVLYSNQDEKTEVVITGQDIFLEAVGRGGGNFEIILPKDFNLENGTEIVLPGITPHVLGTVVKTISDPRDAFVKALVVSPVNIQNLKFVQVER